MTENNSAAAASQKELKTVDWMVNNMLKDALRTHDLVAQDGIQKRSSPPLTLYTQ
jgi:hypothetical protein